jgi:hypothetical protein
MTGQEGKAMGSRLKYSLFEYKDKFLQEQCKEKKVDMHTLLLGIIEKRASENMYIEKEDITDDMKKRIEMVSGH